MPTVAEKLIETLGNMGIRYVFGIPGGPWIPYMEAMRSGGLEFILVANEASAAFMADVSARITGLPGVCHGTFGPGATNLTTGVGCAYLDRSPLIAFTSEQSDAMITRTTQMNIDHQAVYAPLTKWTTRLSGKNVEQTIRKAMHVATSEVPGPVHIGLPSDLADMAVLEGNSSITSAPGIPPPPEPELLETAGQLFRKARRPLLAVGLTAARMKLNKQLAEVVQKHKLPVVLTPMAKGMLPENHPFYAGVLFHALSEYVALTHRQADLVIGIGYDPVEFNYEEWMPDVPLVHIDTSPADIDEAYDLACNVVGDIRHSLAYLAKMDPVETMWDYDELAGNRETLLEALKPKNGGFVPRVALSILREVMPKDGIMTCDVGAHTHLIGQLWQTSEPGLQIMTNGWSSMGFGIPAAIAAKLCLPDRAVTCVCGDGGFLMMAGEMITARRLGLNVVFVVLADKGLSLINVKQERKSHDSYGTRLYNGDFFLSNCFFGVPIFIARDAGEMREALEKSFSAKGPTIVEAVIDGSEYGELIARRYK
jgi:acetolactate synthase-1/2/3 large subunit